MKLERRNWSGRNHRELNRLLDGVRPGEIAVFDWDNTCIFGDIGEALLRRMTFGLEFRMDAAAMAASVPDRINGVNRIRLNGRPYLLKKMKEAIFSAYARLGNGPACGGDAAIDPDFRVFTSGLLALNRALEETPGIGCEFAYPWVNLLLQGQTRSEFERLAGSVIAEALQEPIHRHAVIDPLGRWRYDWIGGIRPYPEMRDLARCWQERGGRMVISTASNRQLVQKTIALTGFPCRQVIGMELVVAGGRFGRTLKPGLKPNLGPGKAANIRARLGAEPVLVAGDSGNDFAMLTAFPTTRMRLVIVRGGRGEIGQLARRANNGENGLLAQEIDRALGTFRKGSGRKRR